MISNGRKVLCALTLIFLCACQSIKLDSGFDSSVDFAAMETFSWSGTRPLLVATAEPVNPSLEGLVMTATRVELEKRGMRYVADAEQADLLVAFTIGRQQIRVGSYPDTFRFTSAQGVRDVSQHELAESELGITMIDAGTRQLVWYGSMRKGIRGADQANVENASAEMIRAILKAYPPSLQ